MHCRAGVCRWVGVSCGCVVCAMYASLRHIKNHKLISQAKYHHTFPLPQCAHTHTHTHTHTHSECTTLHSPSTLHCTITPFTPAHNFTVPSHPSHLPYLHCAITPSPLPPHLRYNITYLFTINFKSEYDYINGIETQSFLIFTWLNIKICIN